MSDFTRLKAGIIIRGVDANGVDRNLLVGADGSLGVSSSTGSTAAKQDTQITAEQAILAKLPTVGTAGTASATVLSVQGVASGVALTTVLGAKPATSTASPTLFTNVGANATLNVKASTGNVFALSCHNANAASRYIQLHNTATVPVTTVTVPVYSFLIPTGGQTIIGEDFFSAAGANFATGIAFAVSTTRDVYTAATAADHSTAIHYK